MNDMNDGADPTLPSIADGISAAEAEASATYDLTIDEVRALNSANYKADYKAYVPPAIARMKRQHAEALDDVEAERDELVAANKLLQTKLDLIGGFGKAADDAALRVVQRRDASIERLTARIRQLHDARRAVEIECDELRARLGEARLEWGVRIFDHDPANATEVMSDMAQAREVADCWREEIEGSNPTLMQRTMRSEGQWYVGEQMETVADDDD